MYKTGIIASCTMAAIQAAELDSERYGHYALDKIAYEGTLRVGSLFKESAGKSVKSTSSGDKNARHAIKITEKAPILYMNHHYAQNRDAPGQVKGRVLEYIDKSLVLDAQKRRGGQFAKIHRQPKKNAFQGFGPGGYDHQRAGYGGGRKGFGLGDKGGIKGRGAWGGNYGGNRKFGSGARVNEFGNKTVFDTNHLVIDIPKQQGFSELNFSDLDFSADKKESHADIHARHNKRRSDARAGRRGGFGKSSFGGANRYGRHGRQPERRGS